MRFDFTLISTVLFASAVLADLSREHHSSQSLDIVEKRATNNSRLAGAVLNSPTTFQSVAGTFKVPFVWGSVGDEVDIMIGLDNGPGTDCGVIFQARLKCTVTSTGPSYKFTTSWSPNSTKLTDIKISNGDIVRMVLAVSNQTTGNAIFVIYGDHDDPPQFETVPFVSKQPFCQKSGWWLLRQVDGHGLARFNTTEIKPEAYDQNDTYFSASGSSVYDFTSEIGLPLSSVEASGNLISVADERLPSSDPIEDVATYFAGAVLGSSSRTFYNITGTITVPYVWGTYDTRDSGVVIWAGLDGGPDTYCATMFSVGILCTGTSSGPTYKAAAAWFPNSLVDFTDVTISPGDHVQVTLGMTDQVTGYATVKNMNSTTSQTIPFSSSIPLCQMKAGWMVQKMGDIGLAYFTKVNIIEPMAYGRDNENFAVGGSVVYDMTSREGKPLTSVKKYGNDVIQVIDNRHTVQ